MKKRILSAVLVSGVTLGAATVVSADNFDAKISDANSRISALTAEQQSAQNQVNALQAQVSSLQAEQDKLTAKNSELEELSKGFEQEIQSLTNQIIARNEKLKNQARSAYKNNETSGYINALLNSKSISDVITRLVAINKAVSANAKMLEQQKADKASLEEKQAANQEAINTIAANMSAIKENQNALRTQQADLEVAKVNLAIQLASAEDEKASLLNQQAAAQQAAAEALAAQQAAQAKAREEAAQQAASVEAAKSAITPAPQATPAAQSSNAIEPAALTAPASPSARPQVSYSSVNNYPVGQCTWGAKSLAPWAGNNWGNGGQWAASAQAAGYSVGSTPMVGAIAVWNDGGYGHVAVVVEVQSSSNIRVMESNYSGKQYIADHRGWFNPTGVTFIYPH
ncbi:TPA: CHAP domain-containing protein [Streptococcus pyogenes]|uniref:Putative secreted protein Streptputative secreted protein n=1 Tax=Streptococcus pyogenes serotype M49 (strain NZ131) TaxID=471876 RepID=A0A0H3BY98_STRPZ|nr:CHAP domain-containing protein [Streptococcus pyogenes]HER4512409.1 CHAP domain-containing protein [Streptococcus pyogenes NGAS729]HER4517530.1 CHAP domain-containing protein [Streptococcus pyogenes NGAS732]HER4536426.1 CHAP domain-containing protein [Streptococcus pyogenes NGAS757]HER4587813.1 CHAP domain-containing protein [Streptococcus pyogenes NGAS615]HER4596301.1 CHAP domain-containing protein [Streptococcus pyogenes NGAS613]HER4603159.1 CHAP domain-containing protein [Streptococcus 